MRWLTSADRISDARAAVMLDAGWQPAGMTAVKFHPAAFEPMALRE